MMAPTPERTLTPPTLDYSTTTTTTSSHVVDTLLGYNFSNKKMSGPSPIRHSVSMLEMNEIDDMKHFLDDVSDRSLDGECHGGLLGGKKRSSGQGGEEEEDDFLFFDAEEEDDVDENVYKLVAAAATTSSSSSRVVGDSSSSSSGGMRRVQSMGAMAVGPNKFSLLTSMAPDIHTIQEQDTDSDDDEEDLHDTTAKKDEGEQVVQVNFGDDKPPSRRPSTNNLRGSFRNSLNSSTHSSNLNSSTHLLDSSNYSNGQPKSCMKKSPSLASMKRSTSNVSFGELEIRSYNITAGDAPTPNGVPLSLDWEHDPTATRRIDVDTYEKNRGERRTKHEMYVPNQYRVYLLMRDAGLSRRQIKTSIEESQRAFKNRQKTMKNLKMQPVEEVMESTKRKFNKLTRKLSGGNS